jgi:hypothetical protein
MFMRYSRGGGQAAASIVFAFGDYRCPMKTNYDLRNLPIRESV